MQVFRVNTSILIFCKTITLNPKQKKMVLRLYTGNQDIDQLTHSHSLPATSLLAYEIDEYCMSTNIESSNHTHLG